MSGSQPNWPPGYTPTSAEWLSEWSLKADATGGTIVSPVISGATITSSTWSGGTITGLTSPLPAASGGTGINNSTSTITLGGSFVTTGGSLTFNLGGNTVLTLPTSGGFVSTILTAGNMLVGNASNVATSVTPTGDWSMSSAGVSTITKIGGVALATYFASPPAIGGTAPAAGAFSTLTASTSVSFSPSGAITLNPTTAGTINNMSVGATTASTVRATTVTATSAGSLLKGLIAGSSPATGNIGEVVQASNNGTTMSSGSTTQLATVSLTAGNWLIFGSVNATPASGHTLASPIAALSLTTASLTGVQAGIQLPATVTNGVVAVNPMWFQSITVTTSYFLNANMTDSGASPVTIVASSIVALRVS